MRIEPKLNNPAHPGRPDQAGTGPAHLARSDAPAPPRATGVRHADAAAVEAAQRSAERQARLLELALPAIQWPLIVGDTVSEILARGDA